MFKKYLSLRWILLATAVLAILSLTVMNVYSLYRLHQTTIESDLENRKMQVSEFADRLHHRFTSPFWGIEKLDIDYVEQQFEETGQFPAEFQPFLDRASSDSMISEIFFKPNYSKACHRRHASLLKYDAEVKQFTPTRHYPDVVCDGMGIARTRMKVLEDVFQDNHRVIFDTNYSMSVALINLSGQDVFGYLTMLINQDYLVNNYLEESLIKNFGNPDSSGVIVWVHDWTENKTVASSAPSYTFDSNEVQYNQSFNDFFDHWKLKVAFTESPTIEASKASLIKNFIVLGVAVVLIFGALGFIFVTAQKERALAERQAGFLANVTHELKTPLAVMQAAGENLADGRVDNTERLQSYGQHIHREAIRLKRMIEKMLDVAQADAGQSIIEPQPYNLKELLEKYLESHRSYIENKGFTLETSLDNALPPVIMDEDSFSTILGNLVENALKYSKEEKYVAINLYQESKKIVLEIIDHGIGIPEKSLKHIFEKFYRVEDPLTAKSKGHGLGLSIVKNLVELNGGEIKVKSKKNIGSRFIVEFPILVSSQYSKVYPQSNGSQSSTKKEELPRYVG